MNKTASAKSFNLFHALNVVGPFFGLALVLGLFSLSSEVRPYLFTGGNQQKIALGRLLHHQASVLLLDEPTRGIDVGSKAQIYQLIGQLAAQGKAIIFVSSYLPELLGVCDTIGVMCRGVLSEVRPAGQWTEHRIIAAAIGQDCGVI